MSKTFLQKMVMSVVSGFFCMTAFGMQKEVILDVCVRVDTSTVFRRNDLPIKHIEKHSRFTTEEPLPFVRYFNVTSAIYTDRFNNSDYIEVEKNLLRQIPSVIRTVSLSKEEQKKLHFPQYVSQVFIDRVKNKELGLVTIGCNRENNVMLKLRYTIEEEQKKEQVIPAPLDQNVQNMMSSSSSLLDYLHLFTEALVALSVMR